MTTAELKELAGAVGWPTAILVFMGFVLWRNGLMKIIFRGDRSEEIAALKSDVRDLEEESGVHSDDIKAMKRKHESHDEDLKALNDRLHQAEKDIGILKDRSNRG